MSKNIKKGFVNQILFEIKKMLGSKFMIIAIGLILIFSLIFPVLEKVQSDKQSLNRYSSEDLVINGQTISRSNPMYWEIREYNEMANHYAEKASSKTDDLSVEYLDTVLKSLLKIAENVKEDEYYKSNLTWEYIGYVFNRFVLEHSDVSMNELQTAVSNGMMYSKRDINPDYYNLTEMDRIKELEKTNSKIAEIENIIINDDHIAFYKYKINECNNDYEKNINNIEQLEKDIIEKPSSEEMYSKQIENYKNNNERITNIEIPIYNFAIEHNIIPKSSDWRYTALNDKKNANYSILNYNVLSQDEFKVEEYLKKEYGSYNEYKKVMQKRLDGYTEKAYIASRSLETGKPDMKYTQDGIRKKISDFIWYSIIIAVFSVIIGGGIVAKEFQDGTIRLLLIRPKKRTKIVLSKLFSLFIICFILYLAAIILNIIMNGIVFGFSDLQYPNYTISSGDNGINFFISFLPEFLICFISVLFACSAAYFLSVLTKNTALSVAIPLVCFVGSLILMQFAFYENKLGWLAYTPLAYINMFLYYIMNQSYSSFVPKFELGIPMVIILSIAMIIFGTIIFNKKDITN